MREFPQSVPYGADQTVYLVVEGSGPHGSARKTERADIETAISAVRASLAEIGLATAVPA